MEERLACRYYDYALARTYIESEGRADQGMRLAGQSDMETQSMVPTSEGWETDLMFPHPQTGALTTIRDAEAADALFVSYSGWALTPEFYEAVWACEAAKLDPLVAGDLRTMVRNALRSSGIDVD